MKGWHAGKNEAAVFVIPDSEGHTNNLFQKEVYARQGKSTHMIVVTITPGRWRGTPWCS